MVGSRPEVHVNIPTPVRKYIDTERNVWADSQFSIGLSSTMEHHVVDGFSR
jgi:hypothetical protein